MSRNATWKNWLTIVVILLATGLVTAVWPLLTGSLTSPAARVEPEVQTIDLSLPIAINGVDSLSLTGWQAAGILTAVVAVIVIVAGLILAFVFTLLDRQTAGVYADEKYQAGRAALDQVDVTRVQQLSQDREVAGVPEHNMPRWSVVSTSLIILIFVYFLGVLITRTFVPGGQMIANGRIVNPGLFITGGLTLLTLLILLWRVRPQKLEAIKATDDSPPPWDFIWVLITGLLVVGLGIGFMVYLNIPG